MALVALAVGTLIIPLVGIIVGAIAILTGNKRKQAQGVGLLVLGLFMCLVYYFSMLERDFQEQQREQQQQQRRRK